MKTKIKTTAIVVAAAATFPIMGHGGSCTLTPSCLNANISYNYGEHCATISEAGGCYLNSGEKVCIEQCASCGPFYTFEKKIVYKDFADITSSGYDSMYVYTCVPKKECPAGYYGKINQVTQEPECKSCPAGTTSLDGAGDVKDCFCARGYYGKKIESTSDTCTRCPSSGGIYGTTKNPGAEKITECYIPANETMTFSDSTGSGIMTFSQDCYYTE